MGTVKRKQLLDGLDFTEEAGQDGFKDGTMTISAGNKNVLFKGTTNKTARYEYFIKCGKIPAKTRIQN